MDNELYRRYVTIYAGLIRYLERHGVEKFRDHVKNMVTRKDAATKKAKSCHQSERALDLLCELALYMDVRDFIDGKAINSVYGCVNDTGKIPGYELIEKYLYDEHEYFYHQIDDTYLTRYRLGY